MPVRRLPVRILEEMRTFYQRHGQSRPKEEPWSTAYEAIRERRFKELDPALASAMYWFMLGYRKLVLQGPAEYDAALTREAAAQAEWQEQSRLASAARAQQAEAAERCDAARAFEFPDDGNALAYHTLYTLKCAQCGGTVHEHPREYARRQAVLQARGIAEQERRANRFDPHPECPRCERRVARPNEMLTVPEQSPFPELRGQWMCLLCLHELVGAVADG